MLKPTETETRLFSFGGKSSQVYTAICDGCGAQIEVSADRMEEAEFDIPIFVKCQICQTPVGMYVA